MSLITRRAALSLPSAILASPAIAQARPMVLEMPSYQLREGFGPWWRAAAEEFAKRNPGLRVNLTEVPFEPHHAQLTTRFIAKNPPDLRPTHPCASRKLVRDIRRATRKHHSAEGIGRAGRHRNPRAGVMQPTRRCHRPDTAAA